VAPKSKTVQNYFLNVLNCIEDCEIRPMRLDFFVKLKYQSSTIILAVGIKYSVPDLFFDWRSNYMRCMQ